MFFGKKKAVRVYFFSYLIVFGRVLNKYLGLIFYQAMMNYSFHRDDELISLDLDNDFMKRTVPVLTPTAPT